MIGQAVGYLPPCERRGWSSQLPALAGPIRQKHFVSLSSLLLPASIPQTKKGPSNKKQELRFGGLLSMARKQSTETCPNC